MCILYVYTFAWSSFLGYEEKLYRAHREQSSMLTGGAAGQLEERIVEHYY